MEKNHADTIPIIRVMNFLYRQLDQLPDFLLDSLITQRQGLKIKEENKTYLVGMVHPRLLDLIALIKERVIIQRKIQAVKSHAKDIPSIDHRILLEWFGFSEVGSDHVLSLLKSCFDREGGFSRKQFNRHIDELAAFQDQIFELLWCLLRQSRMAADRIALLNALPLLVARLKDPRNAMGFPMADLFQTPDIAVVSDRNAFTLANLMLRTKTKESDTDIDRTPEEVLSVRKSLSTDLVNYISRRMEMDHIRVLAKFRTIRAHLLNCQRSPVPSASPVPLHFNLLLELEREGLIFMALAGSETGKRVVREALEFHSDIQSDFFQRSLPSDLAILIGHIQLLVRAIARTGGWEDLEILKYIEQAAPQWMALNSDPAHTGRVQRMLKWVPTAIRSIQAQAH